MVLSTTIKLDYTTIAAVLVAAAAIATGYGAWARRRIDDKRRVWRSEDRAEGYRDDLGHWHQGTHDIVQGWTDEYGTRHPGLEQQFDAHVSQAVPPAHHPQNGRT